MTWITLPDDARATPWMVERAGNLLNLFELIQDGETPCQRLREASCIHPLIKLGEEIHFTPLDIQTRRIIARTMDGIYLGVDRVTGESLIGT